MLRIALIYGSISGAVIIGIIIIGLMTSPEGAGGSHWFGYLIMIAALSIIFVGVKQFRDKERGGVISFRDAFLVGLSITLVASVVYVLVWEIYLASTDYTFIAEYASQPYRLA